MNKQTFLGIACLFALAGCQSRQASQTETPASTETAPAVMTASCYAYTSARDTIRLALRPSGDTLTGELVYKLAEKDQNIGTLRGRMRGDTLLASYTFQSEGTESVREVVFLKQGDALIEGYGPVAEQHGKMVFTDRAKLQFPQTMQLAPTDCPANNP